MSRFAATTRADREALLLDGIEAHRERGSAYCTFVAEADDPESPDPWVQFDHGESLLNLDCTDAESKRLDRFLAEVHGLTITERASPEEAEGTNVRMKAHVDHGRVAQLVERLFREVYDRPADYRLWVTEL